MLNNQINIKGGVENKTFKFQIKDSSICYEVEASCLLFLLNIFSLWDFLTTVSWTVFF